MLEALREVLSTGDKFYIEHARWQKDGTYKPRLAVMEWTNEITDLFQKVHVLEHNGIYVSRWMYPNDDSKYSFRIIIDKDLNNG